MATPDADIEWDDDVEWDDAPAQSAEPTAVVDPRSQSGTAVRSFGQGASLGWSDELRGVSGALQELGSRGPLGRAAALAAPAAALPLTGPLALAQAASAPQLLTGSNRELADYPDLPVVEAMIQRFRADRASQAKDVAAGRKENPKTAMAAEVAGALAVPMPKFAPGATVLGRAAQAGKVGAAIGGASALGASDSGDGMEALRSTLGGAATGAAIGGVVTPLAEVGAERVLKPAAERLANSQAVKAVLGRAGLTNKLKTQLGVRSEQGIQDLGAEVRSSGVLGRLIPNSASGINEANRRVLQGSGNVIGEGIEAADLAVQKAAQQSALTGTPTWTRPMGNEAADAFRRAVQTEAQRTGTAMQLAPEVSEAASALEEPGLNTFRQLWDTKTALGQQAFPQGASRLTERTKLMRAGQQGAARQIESQLEGAIGPDEMARLRDAMKRYSVAKRIQGTVEDAAGRAEARMPVGLGDMQAAQVLSEPGLKSGVLALGSSLVRGRGNAAMALYSPRAARAVGGLGRALGAAGADEAGQSIADPMGPLRQYLGLSPEERRDESVRRWKEEP